MRLRAKEAIAFKNVQIDKAKAAIELKKGLLENEIRELDQNFTKYSQTDLGMALFPKGSRRNATVRMSQLMKTDIKFPKPEWEGIIRKETGYEGPLFEN